MQASLDAFVLFERDLRVFSEVSSFDAILVDASQQNVRSACVASFAKQEHRNRDVHRKDRKLELAPSGRHVSSAQGRACLGRQDIDGFLDESDQLSSETY